MVNKYNQMVVNKYFNINIDLNGYKMRQERGTEEH